MADQAQTPTPANTDSGTSSANAVDVTPTLPAAPATPENKAAAAATTPEPPAAPKNVDEALENASSDDLDAILAELDKKPEDRAQPEDVPSAATDVPVVEEPAAVEPTKADAPTDDPVRARFLKLMDAEPGTDPAELWQRAGGKSKAFAQQAEAREQAVDTTASTAAAADPFADKRAQIDQLKKDRTEARKAYEYDKADEISDAIMDVQREIVLGETQLARQQEEASRFDNSHAETKASVLKDYPAAADPASPLYAALARENAYLQIHDPAFFAKPDFPARLIAKVKESRPDLFSSPPPPAPSQPAAVTPTPKPSPNGKSPNAVVRQTPVGAVVAGDASPTQMTAPDALSAIENMSEAELDALIASMPATDKRGARR